MDHEEGTMGLYLYFYYRKCTVFSAYWRKYL